MTWRKLPHVLNYVIPFLYLIRMCCRICGGVTRDPCLYLWSGERPMPMMCPWMSITWSRESKNSSELRTSPSTGPLVLIWSGMMRLMPGRDGRRAFNKRRRRRRRRRNYAKDTFCGKVN